MSKTKLITNEQIAALKKAVDDIKYAYQHMSPNFDDAMEELTRVTRAFKATLLEQGIYMARELANDWWWTEDYRAQIVGGRVLWQKALFAKDYSHVCLVRLAPAPAVKRLNRYVDPYTLCWLVPIEKGK